MSESRLKKVLMPVEIKSRELSAKLLLSAVLADRGYDVYLGNKIQHTALDKIDPDVYFELSGKDHSERLRRLQEHGIHTFVLETEGSAFHGVDHFSRLLGHETLQYTDCYCAWGNVAKETVEKVSPETRVEVTGNPRFDLLQQPHYEFYAHNVDQIVEEYGDFILFNTNFGRAISVMPNDVKFSYYDDDDPNKDHLREILKKQTKILGEFIRLIAETADEFPDKTIVVRPHPSEDMSFYENCLYAHDNVHIKRELEARPWIMAADVVIHNSCTTGVTSALLETPVIAYVPDGLEAYQPTTSRDIKLSPPNEVSDQCPTLPEVYDTIEEYLSGDKLFTLDDHRKSVLSEYINNINYLSVERIADVMDSMEFDRDKRTSIPVDNKYRARQILVRTLGPKRFEELYVKRIRGEDRDKFPYTSTTEIESIVSRFVADIKPIDLQIERLPYVVNGFRLWCDR